MQIAPRIIGGLIVANPYLVLRALSIYRVLIYTYSVIYFTNINTNKKEIHDIEPRFIKLFDYIIIFRTVFDSN